MKYRLNLSKVYSIKMEMNPVNGRRTRSHESNWYVNDLMIGRGVTSITAGGVADERFEMIIEGNEDIIDDRVMDLLIEVDDSQGDD